MADVKLTALTELTDPTGDDMLYVVDSPSGSPTSKKVSISKAVDRRYQGVPLVDPTTYSWSWVNQGTSTITEANGICYLLPQTGANAYNHRIRVKTAPATPYVITALWSSVAVNGSAPAAGMLFRESSSGKLHTFNIYHINSVRTFYSRKMNSPSSVNTDYTSAVTHTPNPVWMRIADNGVNRILSLSSDGFNFFDWHSIGRTDFLTADQVGFYCDPYGVMQVPTISLHSWAET